MTFTMRRPLRRKVADALVDLWWQMRGALR